MCFLDAEVLEVERYWRGGLRFFWDVKVLEGWLGPSFEPYKEYKII